MTWQLGLRGKDDHGDCNETPWFGASIQVIEVFWLYILLDNSRAFMVRRSKSELEVRLVKIVESIALQQF